MKIGILTLPLGHNYGGILQAWALEQVLMELGHDVKLLTRSDRLSISDRTLQMIRRSYAKFVKHKAGVELFRCEKDTTIKHTRRFINKQFDICHTFSSYSKCIQGLDALIVGSDQVWRPIYADGHLDDYFLRFCDDSNIKKIAYAASFGVDTIEYNDSEVSMASSGLKKFNAVSVREYSGIDLCSNMLGYDDAFMMPDPTLLLTASCYRKIIEKWSVPSSFGNLFTYILDQDESAEMIVEAVSQHLQLIPFTVHSRIDDLSAPLIERIHPPLELWLMGIANSKFVVTDSFHGCVFSIIFNKDFIVLGNRQRGTARISSLLKLFGLEHRYVDTLTTEFDLMTVPGINWDEVNAKHEDMMNQGRRFLIDSLNN